MSIVSNACNAASAVSAMAILVVIWVLQVRRREPLCFSQIQIWFLAGALGIAILWLVLVFGLSRTGIVPNVLVQTLMIIGYFFTVQKLWTAEKNTESLILWSSIAISAAFAIYTSLASNDWLALLYAIRSVVCAGGVVWLMCRIEMANRTPLREWVL